MPNPCVGPGPVRSGGEEVVDGGVKSVGEGAKGLYGAGRAVYLDVSDLHAAHVGVARGLQVDEDSGHAGERYRGAAALGDLLYGGMWLLATGNGAWGGLRTVPTTY